LLDYEGFRICLENEGSVKVVDEGFRLYVDPQESGAKADLILITGEESYSYDAVDSLCGDSTCVVVPASLEGDVPCRDTERIKVGEVMDIFGVEVEAHSLGGNLGYRFVMREKGFYVSGDTSSIENSQALEGRVSICFLSLKQLDPEDIVKAAVRIKPDLTVPYLYRECKSSDLKALSAELEDRSIECSILY